MVCQQFREHHKTDNHISSQTAEHNHFVLQSACNTNWTFTKICYGFPFTIIYGYLTFSFRSWTFLCKIPFHGKNNEVSVRKYEEAMKKNKTIQRNRQHKNKRQYVLGSTMLPPTNIEIMLRNYRNKLVKQKTKNTGIKVHKQLV